MLQNHLENFIDMHSALHESGVYAVAVSGGPDSMALAKLLVDYVIAQNKTLHILTVDHKLRVESAAEAEQVKDWAAAFQNKNIIHQTLHWDADKPDKAVMEAARHARYELMAEYCQAQNISHLFIAHHQDDQAETFLFRLAKGSGLDGLASMASQHDYNDDLTLWRPLLTVPKQDLVDYCQEQNLSFVEDPSNQKEDYARPRLRAARDVLEREGLTAERLALTAKRLRRARSALEELSEEVYRKSKQKNDKNIICLDWSYLKNQPEEIALRVLCRVVDDMQDDEATYGVRREKIEDLFYALWYCEDLHQFKRRTLGGCLFSFDDKNALLLVEQEKKS